MEVKILKDEKTELELEFSEIDYGQLSLIKDTLWQDSSVDMAGFRVDHPQVGKPVFVLKTKGKSAKNLWNDTITKLMKETDGIKKGFKVFN